MKYGSKQPTGEKWHETSSPGVKTGGDPMAGDFGKAGANVKGTRLPGGGAPRGGKSKMGYGKGKKY